VSSGTQLRALTAAVLIPVVVAAIGGAEVAGGRIGRDHRGFALLEFFAMRSGSDFMHIAAGLASRRSEFLRSNGTAARLASNSGGGRLALSGALCSSVP